MNVDVMTAANPVISGIPTSAAEAEEQPTLLLSPSHDKRKVGAGLRRFLSLRRSSTSKGGDDEDTLSPSSTKSLRKYDDAASDCCSTSSASLDTASITVPQLRSCLKKSNSSDFVSTTYSSSLRSSKSRRRGRRRTGRRSKTSKKSVHWNYSDDILAATAPPSSPEYRHPDLWWTAQDLHMRRVLDLKVAQFDQAAQDYLLTCLATRKNCHHYRAALEDDANNNTTTCTTADADDSQETKLKRVLVRDPMLLTGFLEGDFRGMEAAGGPSPAGQDRIDQIRHAAHEVLVAQRNASMYMREADLAEHLAAVSAEQSLLDRCWARLLAVGDVLVMECEHDV